MRATTVALTDRPPIADESAYGRGGLATVPFAAATQISRKERALMFFLIHAKLLRKLVELLRIWPGLFPGWLQVLKLKLSSRRRAVIVLKNLQHCRVVAERHAVEQPEIH
jgi:hypothetical protein